MSTSSPNTPRLLLTLALGLALAALAWLWFREPGPVAPDTPLDAEEGDTTGARDGSLLESESVGAVLEEERTRDRQELARREATLAFVRGRVLDGSARGLPGATVRLHPIDIRGMRGAPYPDAASVAEGQTDREGLFRLPTQATGWLRVVASAPGRATVGRRIAGPGVAVDITLPLAATLRVLVVDPDGAPIAEAEVAAHLGDSRAYATSDASGVASLDTLPPGSARLRVGAPGYGTVVAGPHVVRAGESAEAVVMLPVGVTVQGTVRDAETGSPIAGAVVHVARPGQSEAAEPTGADGRFGPLPAGGQSERVFLAASADGYAPALLPVVLGAAPRLDLDPRLTRAAPWTGRVENARGQAVPGARVAYSSDGVAGRAPAETTTDKQGAFELPPPPPPAPGRRVVLFAESGSARAALALRPGSPRPDPLVLRLLEGGAVRGQVRDASGAPQPGVEVRLTPVWDQVRDRGNPDAATSLLLLSNEQGLSGLSGATDESGTWVIGAVAPGPYHVRYQWNGGSRWREAPLEVAGPSTDAGSETIGAGAQLNGRVTDRSGTPVAGAELRLTPERDSRRGQRTTSDPTGWFHFVGVEPGTHALRATLGSLAPYRETVIVEGSGEQRLDVQFDAGTTFLGRVLTPTGAPYRGILRVSLRRDGQPRPDRTPHGTRVQNGALRIEDLPTGRWIVEVQAGASLLGSAGPIDLDSGRTTETTIQLAESLPLQGKVVGSGGRPSSGATIGLMHDGTGRHLLVTADGQGAFQVDGLTPGTWTASVSGPGGAAVSERLDISASKATRVRLQLAPAGDAHIEVRGERGGAVAQALVLFRLPDGTLATRKPIRTDRKGEAQALDLPIERLLVTVRTLDGRRGTGEIYIAEGEVANLLVTVKGGR